MRICSGKGKKDLLEKLLEINETQGSYNLVKKDEAMVIKIRKGINDLGMWEILSQRHPGSKKYKSGKGFEQLSKELHDARKKYAVEYNYLNVIALVNVDIEKTFDGNTRSRWVVIDPYDPYEIENDFLKYKIEDFVFTDKEILQMQDTGIALWDRINNVYLPFTNGCIPNLGRLLDCQMAFSTDQPIHSAMIIADKIIEKSDVEFLCRGKGQVRPVYAVLTSRYKQINEEVFLSNILTEIGKSGMYTVPRWDIYDDETIVEIHRTRKGNRTYGYFVSCGNMPGRPVKATAFVKISNYKQGAGNQENYIYIGCNKKSHKKVNNTDVSIISFDGEFERFDVLYQKLPEINITPEMCENIINTYFLDVLGVRRLSSLKLPDKDVTGYEFLNFLLMNTNVEFGRKSERWQTYLRNSYYSAIKKMVGEPEESEET